MAAVPSVTFPFKGSDSNSYAGQTVPLATGGQAAVDTVVQTTALNRGGLTIVRATSAAPAAGGSGYAVGDTITNAAGSFAVATASSGAVTAVTVASAAALTATTSGALAQTATSGAGTGCTLTPVYAAAAVQVAPANASRRGFSIQNQSTGTMWFSGMGTASADYNSVVLGPGDLYESSPHHVGTGAISLIGIGAGQAYYAREF